MNSYSRPKRRSSALFLLLFLALFPSAMGAQNSRGTLRGVVQDSNGGRIPGAKIVVHAAESPLQREATSDSRGEFRIDDLLPGTYQARVNAPGFTEARADVKTIISSLRKITLTLKPRAIQERVSVQRQPSSIATHPIDTSSAVHQTVITSQDLNTIPLAPRSFANIAHLAPGTEPVEPSDPTNARITAVSTGGSSGPNNRLSVDRGSKSDDCDGCMSLELSA